MQITWDEKKRQSNRRKHGIDFLVAEHVFDGVTVTIEDKRFLYPETRYISIGMSSGRTVVVAHTETDSEIRIISIRKATQSEQKIYFRNIGLRQEPD